MQKHIYSWLVPGIILPILFPACIQLKELNQYAAGSVKSISKFDELGYSFDKACHEKCVTGQLEKQEIIASPCHCMEEKSADSVNQVIYHVIKNYFEGLADLSANTLTSYKFSGLTNALKQGNFGSIEINNRQVDAYGKIASIISRAVADGYRRKKLATYIGEANEPIKILLDAFSETLESNLSMRLQTEEQRLRSYYADLAADAGTSLYEKKKIIEEYNNATELLSQRKKLISGFTRGLKSISSGHESLYQHRNTLKSSQLREMLMGYYSNIRDIADEFNNIKNTD